MRQAQRKGFFHGLGPDGFEFVLKLRSKLNYSHRYLYRESNEENVIRWGQFTPMDLHVDMIKHKFPAGDVWFMPCVNCVKLKREVRNG